MSSVHGRAPKRPSRRPLRQVARDAGRRWRGALGPARGPFGRPGPDLATQVRTGTSVLLVGLLVLSGYGSLAPATLRCGLPGDIGCPGGLLGMAPAAANSSLTMWFNVTMPDYGFWIVNTVDGSNETTSWTVYEGYTIHINATSTRANAAVGGTAYHGLGIELNQTGQQLMDLSAPVGKWVQGSFLAPSHEYHRQHIWCTIGCGQGHDGMQRFVLNIVPATSVPSVSVAASVTSGPAPLNVALTGTVRGGTAPYTYSWDFGDGSAGGTTGSLNHTYQLSGVYAAALSVTDAAHQVATGSVSITVGAATPLAATIVLTAANGTVPFLTTVAAQPNGGVAPYTFAWNLGDGTNATSRSVTHVYTGAGIFGISLTVTDAVGTTTSATASVGVRAPTGSLAVAVTATPGSAPAPLNATFVATASGGSAPYVTTWFFGDGNYGLGSPASHRYDQPGEYTALAFVADATGRAGSNTTSLVVAGAPTSGPQADLTVVPSGGSAPLDVVAVASAVGGSLNYSSVSWMFGDGSTGSGWTAPHRYAANGAYTLSVRVVDTAGHSATASQTVQVRGLSIAITLNRTAGDSPFSLGAAATVVGGSGSYGPITWSWGDGTSTSGTTANHSYAAAVVGAVRINATVTDSLGATALGSATVQILPGPIAHVTASVTVAHEVPVAVTFVLAVTGGSPPYSPLPLWTFGDGATTRGGSPQSHTFVRFGHFEVTIETNDSVGATTAATVWVNLSAPGSNVNGGAQVWTFTGIGNPNDAALVLLGLAAATGLFILHRKRLARALTPAATRPTPRPGPGSASPGPTAPPGRDQEQS